MFFLFWRAQSPQLFDQIACRGIACSLLKSRYRRDELIPVGEGGIVTGYNRSERMRVVPRENKQADL